MELGDSFVFGTFFNFFLAASRVCLPSVRGGGDKERDFDLFGISFRRGLASLEVSKFEFCVGVLNDGERV